MSRFTKPVTRKSCPSVFRAFELGVLAVSAPRSIRHHPINEGLDDAIEFFRRFEEETVATTLEYPLLADQRGTRDPLHADSWLRAFLAVADQRRNGKVFDDVAIVLKGLLDQDGGRDRLGLPRHFLEHPAMVRFGRRPAEHHGDDIMHESRAVDERPPVPGGQGLDRYEAVGLAR